MRVPDIGYLLGGKRGETAARLDGQIALPHPHGGQREEAGGKKEDAEAFGKQTLDHGHAASDRARRFRTGHWVPSFMIT